jgi:hypothetical protein
MAFYVRRQRDLSSLVVVGMKIPLVLVTLLGLLSAAYAAGPQPPCQQQQPTPAYAGEGAVSQSGVWLGADLRRDGWSPAACLGWTGDSRLVAALAGTFRSSLTLDQLVGRMTDVSAYPLVNYWSVSHQAWRPIALEAQPVASPAGAAATDIYYVERNDLSGKSTYRLAVLQRTTDRAVIVSQNVSPIRIAVITAFEPGALQLALFIERAGPDLWHLYALTRVGSDSSSLVGGSPSSYLNRLDAFRRYLAGTPTNQEPPLKKD